VVKHDDDAKKAVTIMTTKRMPALPVVDDCGRSLDAVYLFELLSKSGRVGMYAKKISHVSPESSLFRFTSNRPDGSYMGAGGRRRQANRLSTLQSINRAYSQRLGKGKGGAQQPQGANTGAAGLLGQRLGEEFSVYWDLPCVVLPHAELSVYGGWLKGCVYLIA